MQLIQERKMEEEEYVSEEEDETHYSNNKSAARNLYEHVGRSEDGIVEEREDEEFDWIRNNLRTLYQMFRIYCSLYYKEFETFHKLKMIVQNLKLYQNS